MYFNFIPCIIQRLMLTVLTLLIRRKNPVIADFTEAKRNRQDAKKSVAFRFLTGIQSLGKQPGSIFQLFQIM